MNYVTNKHTKYTTTKTSGDEGLQPLIALSYSFSIVPLFSQIFAIDSSYLWVITMFPSENTFLFVFIEKKELFLMSQSTTEHDHWSWHKHWEQQQSKNFNKDENFCFRNDELIV